MKEKSSVRYKEFCPASMEKPPFQTDEPLPAGVPMPSPMPEPDPRGTGYTEYRESDCIEAPIEGINNHMMRHVSSLVQVSSTGLFRVGDRFHNFQSGFASYCVFITLEGRGRCRYRGIARDLKRGDILFNCNYEPTQTFSTDEEWLFCFFNLYGEPCRLYEEMWNRGGFEIISVDNVEHYDEYRRLVNEAINRPGRASFLEIHRLMTDMFTELLVARERQADTAENASLPTWVNDAMQYMSVNYRENQRISDIADRYFLSVDYFTRTFKKFTGKTPKEYLTFCRIDEAAILLRGTNLSVAEIASEAGFASQSLFTRVFRRVYGCTPLEYRKKGLKK